MGIAAAAAAADVSSGLGSKSEGNKGGGAEQLRGRGSDAKATFEGENSPNLQPWMRFEKQGEERGEAMRASYIHDLEEEGRGRRTC